MVLSIGWGKREGKEDGGKRGRTGRRSDTEVEERNRMGRLTIMVGCVAYRTSP